MFQIIGSGTLQEWLVIASIQVTLKQPKIHNQSQVDLLTTLGSAKGAGAIGCASRVAAVGVLGAAAPSDPDVGRGRGGAAGGDGLAVGALGPEAGAGATAGAELVCRTTGV